MTIITEQLNKLKDLRRNLELIARQELIKERDFIATLNRTQLSRGTKADGKDMPDYVDGSNAPMAPGKIELFDTGDFYEGIDVLFEDVELNLVGTDVKTDFLVAKYGEILGLTEQSIKRLQIRLERRMKVRILNILS